MSYKTVKTVEGRRVRIVAQDEPEGIPRERSDVYGKARRAYSAYLELRDTAAWLNEELAAQLRVLELSVQEFRVLEILRSRPHYLEELSRKLNCQKGNVWQVVTRLRASGWVRRRQRRLATSNGKWAFAIERGVQPRGAEPRGRLVTRITLTDRGRAKFRVIHYKHVKLLKAYMRALDGREQLTLRRLCMKLRRGNVLKFALEARYWLRDIDWAEVAAQR